MRKTRPLADRFNEKVDRSGGPAACWPTSLATRNGYPTIGTEYGHRLAYELAYGPIPDAPGHHGTVVMHSCDNRWCVNPAHLKLGSQSDNIADAVQKGRMHYQSLGAKWKNGESLPQSKLTADQVTEMRRLHAAGDRIVDIAVRFKIGKSAAHYAISGVTWQHLPGARPGRATMRRAPFREASERITAPEAAPEGRPPRGSG